MAFKRNLIFFISIFCVTIASARENISPQSSFWWGLLIPGGGYFYQGETAKGISYLATTGGLIGWGIAVNKEKDRDEINTPWVYAQQVHGTQLYLSYREAIRKSVGKTHSELKILQDRSTVSDLALASFRKENLLSPWVIGFAALGVGLNYLGARLDKVDRDFWDIRETRILGNNFSRQEAFGVYSAYWIPISMGAAVSEESVFRGMIQSGWEDKWGKTKGLLAASALFGVAHYNGSGPSASNALFAAVAGTFLGWRYQEQGYRLSEAIAAHFWFDVAAGLTIFLTDPDSNPLGAKVEFSF